MTHTELLELLERVRQGMTTRDDADKLEAYIAGKVVACDSLREQVIDLEARLTRAEAAAE